MHEDSVLPLVSIGVPVFNEGRFIAESLHSLLKQDYPNLEIIISDNASTDNTQKICEASTRNSPKVVYHAFMANLGITENFRHVLRLSRGKYFMWASGHDLWEPNFVSECVHALENNPDAVLAFGSSVWVDETGDKMGKTSGWSDTRGMGPLSRFFTILWGNMHPILGVIKRSELPQIEKIGNHAGADLALLAELVLKGHFIHATKTNWKRREFRRETNYSEKLKRYRSDKFGISRDFFNRLFPVLQLPYRLTSILFHSRIPVFPKALAVIVLLATLPARYIAGVQNL